MDSIVRLYQFLTVNYWSPAGSLGVLVNQVPRPVL